MKDPMDILAERLAQLEATGQITPDKRQMLTNKLIIAKASMTSEKANAT